MRDLIKDTLPLMEEEENKAQALGGFELGTSRLQGRRSNHFGTITAREKNLRFVYLCDPQNEGN